MICNIIEVNLRGELMKNEQKEQISTQEYLDGLISIFTKDELELIREVYEKHKEKYMEEEAADVLSICIETLLMERKEQNLPSITISSDTRKMIKRKMIQHIRSELNSKFSDAEMVSTLSTEESYEQEFNEEEDFLQVLFCGSSLGKTQVREAELIKDHIRGLTHLELIQKYDLSKKKVLEIIKRKKTDFCEMYEHAVVGQMSAELCQKYQEDIKNYAHNSDSYEDRMKKMRMVERYISGKKPTSREQAVYDSVVELKKVVYQKSLPRRLG